MDSKGGGLGSVQSPVCHLIKPESCAFIYKPPLWEQRPQMSSLPLHPALPCTEVYSFVGGLHQTLALVEGGGWI